MNACRPDERELERLYDLSPDALCIAGCDGYLKFVNPAFAHTLGYTQEELLTRPFSEFAHPDDREAVRAFFDELAAGNDVVGVEYRQLCADGSVRWFEWNTSTRPGADVVYGVARDVTERHCAGDQLRALHRLATLAAEGVEPRDLFAVVAEEVSRVVGVPIVNVLRYEPDGTATECGSFTTHAPVLPIGGRVAVDGTKVLRAVRETGRPARVDGDYDSGLEGELAEIVRRGGIRSAAGIPIVVAGRLWGAMIVSCSAQRLPPGIEAGLSDFTELLATAIENAEGRRALQQLADEQAALRRVATLVARGVRPVELFSAVSVEVGGLFGTDLAAVVRFDAGPSLVFVGLPRRDLPISIGTRWELEEFLAGTEVFLTGHSARADKTQWASADHPIAEILRRLGMVATVASPIVVEGRLWGAITFATTDEPPPLDAEERLEKFTELVATAIANAQGKSELAASRRRIVAASDEARRRIERDLHDGTQQRLVSLALAVRNAEAGTPPEMHELREELSRIATGVADAVEELREITRGIHPAILTEGGLAPALRTLARRSSIPVALHLRADMRVPEPIEVAGYFVASEAMANATKHAHASRLDVSLAPREGGLLLSIDDDGIGGADPRRGSGLVGLYDRVAAVGGSINVRSRPGQGTHITAELPLELARES